MAATVHDLHELARAFVQSRDACAAFHGAFDGRPNPAWTASTQMPNAPRAAIAQLEEVLDLATFETRPIIEALISVRDQLDWWNIYSAAAPVGKGVLDQTASCMLSGQDGAYTAPFGMNGFFYLRQGVEYASHRHQPREIYAVIAGNARFWDERTGWRDASAGDVVLTPEHRWHAMEMWDAPVLILWCWIGEGFDVLPEFQNNTGALPGQVRRSN